MAAVSKLLACVVAAACVTAEALPAPLAATQAAGGGGPPGPAPTGPPLPPAVASFDIHKFSGRWYQHRVDVNQLKNQGGQSLCASEDFEIQTFGPSGHPTSAPWLRGRGMSQTKAQVGTKDAKVVFTNATQLGGSHAAGELNVQFAAGAVFPGSPVINAPENLVHYVEKNGVYDFMILTNGASKFTGDTFQTVFALSRDTAFNPVYDAAFKAFLRTHNFTVPIYNVLHNEACYYGGPGVSPPILNSVNVSAFTGLWYQHQIDIRQLVFQGGETICAAVWLSLEGNPFGTGAALKDHSTTQKGPGMVGPSYPIHTISADVTRNADGPAGDLVVHFGANVIYPGSKAFTSPLWVVDVAMGPTGNEYDYYVGTGGAGAYNSVFFNSRTKQPSQAHVDRFKRFLKDTGFWVDLYEVQQPDNCAYFHA